MRLGLSPDKPVAVQQWQGLIAGTGVSFSYKPGLTIYSTVNYAARKFGVGRHCNVNDAKKACPGINSKSI